MTVCLCVIYTGQSYSTKEAEHSQDVFVLLSSAGSDMGAVIQSLLNRAFCSKLCAPARLCDSFCTKTFFVSPRQTASDDEEVVFKAKREMKQ